MSTAAQWAPGERLTGIGGSEVAALFGVHPWKTRYQLWLEKTGKVDGDVRETPDIRRGRLHEPVAAQLYVERTGARVQPVQLLRHPEHEFLFASADRMVMATPERAEHPLEIKCPRSWVFPKVKREGLPDYAILQGQQEAAVWGAAETEYVVYGSDDADIVVFPIPFDPEAWDRIVNVAGEFWHDCVMMDIPPDEDTEPPAPVNLPEVKGEMVRRTDEAFADAAREWREAKEVAEEAGQLRDQAKARLIELVGEDALGCYEGGGVRFYYAERAGRRSFDEQSLRGHGALDPLKVMAWLDATIPESGDPAWMAQLRAEWALDLEQFVKRGAPFRELRGYPLRAAAL